MPSIKIDRFSGLNTRITPRNLPKDAAQVAHNCLLLDGSIRPLAKWVSLMPSNRNIRSINVLDNGAVETTPFQEAAFVKNTIYSPKTKVGLLDGSNVHIGEGQLDGPNNVRYSNKYTTIYGAPVAVYRPQFDAVSVTYTRQYHSNKPVARAYALSGVRINKDGTYEESALSVIAPGAVDTTVYEGDLANISGRIYSPDIDVAVYGYDLVRIYRAMSGMETAATAFNELDTEWILVKELNVRNTDGAFNYVDNGVSTNSSLDVYLADRFYPPAPNEYNRLQLLEGGWFAISTASGEIHLSERYMYHAWPTENVWNVGGDNIVCMKAHLDGLFIGTSTRPYMLAISTGDPLAVQGNVTPFLENYPCLNNSMDSTPSGAMYASYKGVVSLTRGGMEVITSNIAIPNKKLYSIPVTLTNPDTGTDYTIYLPIYFKDTIYGAYYLGKYLGFCVANTKADGSGDNYYAGYMYTTGSTLDGDDPLQRLTTLDTPSRVMAHATSPFGLYVLTPDAIYTLPFPGAEGGRYESASKACYTWKSKKFVFPGNMVMGACKVLRECKGHLKIKFYVDCCCAYETDVVDCKPFTLPPNMAGIEWEIELIGTAVVNGVHVASSTRELLENE